MERAPVLWRYFVVNAFAVFVNLLFYLAFVRGTGLA